MKDDYLYSIGDVVRICRHPLQSRFLDDPKKLALLFWIDRFVVVVDRRVEVKTFMGSPLHLRYYTVELERKRFEVPEMYLDMRYSKRWREILRGK